MKKSFPYTRQFAQVGKPLRQLLMEVSPISNCRRSCVANAALTPPQVVHRPRNCLPYTPFSSQNPTMILSDINSRKI